MWRTSISLLVLAWTVLFPVNIPAQSAASDTLRIYLARHGESEANLARRVSGWRDDPLTPKGREQAAALREILGDIRIDAVYSSTLSRSRETARILQPGATVTALDSLREKSGGRFEGGPTDDPDLLRRLQDANDSLDGGESLNQLAERVRTALVQIRKKHPSGTVLIVGHAWTNRAILRLLLELPQERATAIDQANDELYLIEQKATGPPRLWKLIRSVNLGDL